MGGGLQNIRNCAFPRLLSHEKLPIKLVEAAFWLVSGHTASCISSDIKLPNVLAYVCPVIQAAKLKGFTTKQYTIILHVLIVVLTYSESFCFPCTVKYLAGHTILIVKECKTKITQCGCTKVCIFLACFNMFPEEKTWALKCYQQTVNWHDSFVFNDICCCQFGTHNFGIIWTYKLELPHIHAWTSKRNCRNHKARNVQVGGGTTCLMLF